ncbi:hypothetical protein AXFE_27390 [Acidithrix ferrooxidans]|uniref:Uncharacterized protein n=1 Tax=Acidithrix ferrooxidans TaxID=1280514 RepID=A0A0D8HEL7_9ACTN|nr:hypothetical protein AXFE_27390 [Acidithrix ferrooxidans]
MSSTDQIGDLTGNSRPGEKGSYKREMDDGYYLTGPLPFVYVVFFVYVFYQSTEGRTLSSVELALSQLRGLPGLRC